MILKIENHETNIKLLLEKVTELMTHKKLRFKLGAQKIAVGEIIRKQDLPPCLFTNCQATITEYASLFSSPSKYKKH